jgi:predicted NAD-dependent protein-ADP-ribosyltransferase YbiA (DUF1768 family)
MRWESDGEYLEDCVVFFKVDQVIDGLPVGQLSNMSPSYPLMIGGVKVDSTEALYQALRFPHEPDWQREILAAPNAMRAKMAAKKGFDLRLMSAVDGVSRIPTEGKNLVVVAAVEQVLHFRIFDGHGKTVVDMDEKRLTEQVRAIEDLRKQLKRWWPPHELTGKEKARVITAVTSIVGHTPRRDGRSGFHSRPDWQKIRVEVMRWVIRVRLAQHYRDFFVRLLDWTESRPIVERSRKDQFWGAVLGEDGVLRGGNQLGRLLVELRDEARALSAEGREAELLRVAPPAIENFLLLGQPIGVVEGTGVVARR